MSLQQLKDELYKVPSLDESSDASIELWFIINHVLIIFINNKSLINFHILSFNMWWNVVLQYVLECIPLMKQIYTRIIANIGDVVFII